MIVESVELRMRYLVIYTMRTPTLSDFPRQENSHPYLIQTLPFNHKYPIEFLDHANEVNLKKKHLEKQSFPPTRQFSSITS